MTSVVHQCDEGNIEAYFRNIATGEVRFTYLACPQCGGRSMGNGQRPGEVRATVEEYTLFKQGETRQRKAA